MVSHVNQLYVGLIDTIYRINIFDMKNLISIIYGPFRYIVDRYTKISVENILHTLFLVYTFTVYQNYRSIKITYVT